MPRLTPETHHDLEQAARLLRGLTTAKRREIGDCLAVKAVESYKANMSEIEAARRALDFIEAELKQAMNSRTEWLKRELAELERSGLMGEMTNG